ncbi:MAG: hypothetical protein GQ574_03485 [Crocinitomix sp.]|nr:hypothetical protein [Crocinitomix sp.]
MEKEDQQLKNTLQEAHDHDSPSLSFTANVMRKVEAKRAAKLKPIIGKWAWILIAVLLLGVISTPVLSNWSSLSSETIDMLIPHIKLGLTITIMSGLFILFDEFFLRKRKTTT